jgi:integrase
MQMRIPSYRRHNASGQAVVTLGGKDFYLGRWGSEVSKAEYRRLLTEWAASGGHVPNADADPVVSELLPAYIRHVDVYYRKDGVPTSEPRLIRLSLGVLKRLHGHTPAADFGPLALKAVRQAFIEGGLCRKEVNRRTGYVKRFFKWCVEHELIPPSVHHGLSAVPGLRKGRTDVRESEPVKPVPDAFVDAIRPYVAPAVWCMVELQRLTGMRPSEATIMRTRDLDVSGDVWVYTPHSHKTQHHGKERRVYLGPRAQTILRPWLRTELDAYLFSPRRVMEEKNARRRRDRQTPMTPSQKARKRKQNPRKTPGERYSANSYTHAIATACNRAGVPRWSANRLRHNAATRLRREHGLDVARVILGHSSPAVTEVYAEVDHVKAMRVMGTDG